MPLKPSFSVKFSIAFDFSLAMPRSAPSSAPSSAPAPAQRQRLKPETREQLLARLLNPELSLHEAAVLLKVCRATVRRYADSHQIPCTRTPGGQRRFRFRDVEKLYQQIRAKR